MVISMAGPHYKRRVLTGDRPTGRLHLGHLAGSLEERVKAQKEGKDVFVLVADAQMLTDNPTRGNELNDLRLCVMDDYLSVGLDAERVTFVRQTGVPELATVTAYLANLVSVAQVGQNPTVKHEMRERGFSESVPLGFFMYPVSQASDILSFCAHEVPVGEDQLPMIQLTRLLAERLHSLYNFATPTPRAVLSNAPRLPGIDGSAKASKSLGNAILLSDASDKVAQKVQAMFTDPNHVRVSDPGQVEGNVVFAYLDAFMQDRDELEEMKAHYRRGGMGDVTTKKRLVEVLEEVLLPIRERRQDASQTELSQLLEEGTQRARAEVREFLTQLEDAIGVSPV